MCKLNQSPIQTWRMVTCVHKMIYLLLTSYIVFPAVLPRRLVSLHHELDQHLFTVKVAGTGATDLFWAPVPCKSAECAPFFQLELRLHVHFYPRLSVETDVGGGGGGGVRVAGNNWYNVIWCLLITTENCSSHILTSS